MADRIVEIEALGAQGDGIGAADGGRVFVPLALPGERWRQRADGFVREGGASPERQQPPCPHFGACGGCAAQHMAPALYTSWKRQILVDALAKAGIAAPVADLVSFPPASRRRLVMVAMRLPEGIALGFHARASDRLVAIEHCAVASPRIVAALPLLRSLAMRLIGRKKPLRMTVTEVDAGLDVALDEAKSPLAAEDRAAVAALLAGSSVLRVSVDDDPLLTRGAPLLTLGSAAVVPPPGVFLQASRPAEQAMSDLVCAGVGKAKVVADLFSGLGTFTLPLAKAARVTAIDTDKAALAALDTAARNAKRLKPIEVRQRDLMREPLSRKELEPFDAVVFDPPRAGAEAQAAALAKSVVPVVVAVSCNPVTLARDLGILVDGGYVIDTVVPVDQFAYSPHLETVATLRRPSTKRRA